MDNKILRGLIWLFVALFCSLLMNFVQKKLIKIYDNKKQEIELNKKKYPNESFKLKENINNHLLKSYINSLIFFKWFTVLMGILIFFRIYFSEYFENN